MMDPEMDGPNSDDLQSIIEQQTRDLFESEGLGDLNSRQSRAMFPDVSLEVLSAVDAMEFDSDEPWACISIASHQNAWPEISEVNRTGILQLAFYDVELVSNTPGANSFNRAMAQEVLDFVLEQAPNINILMIHCERGESRSVGVAAGIAHFFGKDARDFEGNGNQRPNSLVYSLLRENTPTVDIDEYDIDMREWNSDGLYGLEDDY